MNVLFSTNFLSRFIYKRLKTHRHKKRRGGGVKLNCYYFLFQKLLQILIFIPMHSKVLELQYINKRFYSCERGKENTHFNKKKSFPQSFNLREKFKL